MTIAKQCSILIAMTLFGAACEHAQAPPESWIGKPTAELISAWGKPDTTTSVTGGTSVLTWKSTYLFEHGVRECRKSFTVGPDDKITDWSFENCR